MKPPKNVETVITMGFYGPFKLLLFRRNQKMHSLCCVNVYIYIYIYITVNDLLDMEGIKLEAQARVFCILVLNEQYETHLGLPVKCPMFLSELKCGIS